MASMYQSNFDEQPLSLISSQMMAAQTRPPYKRGASSAWNRLNQPPSDPLEQYGLPSKGETKLNDFRAQEKFFAKIQERYMKFCGSTGGGDALEKAFDQLSLSEPPSPSSSSSSAIITTIPSPNSRHPPTPTHHLDSPLRNSPRPPAPASPSRAADTSHSELILIFAAMRKLRESIVATARTDAFARKAYIFLIHAAILARAWHAYHPALLYLLTRIHPASSSTSSSLSSSSPGALAAGGGGGALSGPELREFASYRVLDLACREGDLGAAFEARARWGVGDRRVEGVLRALVRGDWHAFWRLRRAVDGYQRKVMDWAEEGVRLHAMKCLGMTYNQAERRFVERCAEAGWEELKRRGCGWECEGEWIMIRKRKTKS
ncbi:MAG: hypothetical protein Q9165_001262 [Trypethelium subeluteriae]